MQGNKGCKIRRKKKKKRWAAWIRKEKHFSNQALPKHSVVRIGMGKRRSESPIQAFRGSDWHGKAMVNHHPSIPRFGLTWASEGWKAPSKRSTVRIGMEKRRLTTTQAFRGSDRHGQARVRRPHPSVPRFGSAWKSDG